MRPMARRLTDAELRDRLFGKERRSTLYAGCIEALALLASCLIVFAVVVVGLWPS